MDVMTRDDLERMRVISSGRTGGSYEEQSHRDSPDLKKEKKARVRSKRKIEQPSDYYEREEFYEAVTASWNMEGKFYRKPAYYAMDADVHIMLRQETEVLKP